MDLFYLNGSLLLFFQLNYRSNVPFSQKKRKKKKEKSNLTEEKMKTQFTTLLTLYFWDFSLSLFFFLMDSKKHLLAETKALPDTSDSWVNVLLSRNDLTRTPLSRH